MKTTFLAMAGLIAIAQTLCLATISEEAIAQPNQQQIKEITVPPTNFFPETGNQIVVPSTNFFPDLVKPGAIAQPSNTTTPLQPTPPDQIKYTEEPAPKILEFTATEKNPSALERPMWRLFGFETAYTLKQSEFVFQISGASYSAPNDFRLLESPGSGENRSNDTNIALTYGITDNVQIGIQSSGKDDTAFANLVRPNSSLQFFYGSISGQVKWRYYDQESLKAALVVGAEFASPVPALFSRGSHTITYATPGPRTVSDGGAGDEFKATDGSVYFSLGFPIAYQLSKELSLHLNPQVSFFPSNIPASTTSGSTANLIANNVGFNGSSLDYYGTVVGLGFGVNYAITPRLQFAADITPILTGRNSAGVTSDNSLFVRRLVWNAGIQFAPNSRTAFSLYATNRFGPSASAASNLLVQPNGDIGYGLQLSYLPDFSGTAKIERRASYPEPSAFLTYLDGLPSTTLPIYSTLYQFALGTAGRYAPTIRFGLLDDFELALNLSSNNGDQLPIELSALARLALVQDEGKDYSFASTLGVGVTNLYRRTENLQSAVTLYFDLPTSYRVNSKLTLTANPKVYVPAQFQGIQNILGLSLGAIYNITDTTQILGQYTPIFSGSNQLQSTNTSGQFQTVSYSGKTGIFNVGLRQLFPAGNSLYALDLYFTNSSGDYGLQGISAPIGGGTQVGIRFNVLNGVPSNK